MFTALKQQIHDLVTRLDGEAVKVAEQFRDEAIAEVHAAEEKIAGVAPLIAAFQAGLGPHLASLPPEIRKVVDGLLSKLAGDVEKLLGDHPAA